jgi:hypothetical protein
MNASDGGGIVVVGQVIAVALSRARERLVALCGAALGTDGGGLRRVSAPSGRRIRGGTKHPEDRGKPCIGGLSEGRHMEVVLPRDLADWIGASYCPVWCIGAVDGPGIAPA